jgi:acetyl esterase
VQTRLTSLVVAALLATVVASPVAIADDAPPGDVPAPPNAVAVEMRTVPYATVDGTELFADAYVPATTATDRPVIVFIHGGGWAGGARESFGVEAGWMARLGFVTFSIEYRLSPPDPYPAAVDDVERFVRWLRRSPQVATFGIDPKKIGAFGSSAGGHLAAMLGTVGMGSRTTGSRVAAVVSWSGPMDLTDVNAVVGGSTVTGFLGCTPPDPACLPTARAASPITHLDRSDAPTLLFNSTRELVPYTQATTAKAALAKAGVPHRLVTYEGEMHAQWYRVQAWDRTVAWFERYLGTPPRS